MVRYLIPSLVVGLLVGGGMNITLADDNNVEVTRTEYETLLSEVESVKADTQKILEILEKQETNVAEKGGEVEEEKEAVPSKRSGGEINDTNDYDSGEEGMSNGVEAEEVDKEVDKEEEVLCPSCNVVTDKSEIEKNKDGLCNGCTDRMIKCPKCGEYHHKLYVEKGECYNLYECSNCFKEFTLEELDENWNCKDCVNAIVVPPTEEEPPIQEPPATEGEPQEPIFETTICPTCEQEYTKGAWHECPRVICDNCDTVYIQGEQHSCPPQPEVPQPTPEPESSQQEIPQPTPEIEYSYDNNNEGGM